MNGGLGSRANLFSQQQSMSSQQLLSNQPTSNILHNQTLSQFFPKPMHLSRVSSTNISQLSQPRFQIVARQSAQDFKSLTSLNFFKQQRNSQDITIELPLSNKSLRKYVRDPLEEETFGIENHPRVVEIMQILKNHSNLEDDYNVNDSKKGSKRDIRTSFKTSSLLKSSSQFTSKFQTIDNRAQSQGNVSQNHLQTPFLQQRSDSTILINKQNLTQMANPMFKRESIENVIGQIKHKVLDQIVKEDLIKSSSMGFNRKGFSINCQENRQSLSKMEVLRSVEQLKSAYDLVETFHDQGRVTVFKDIVYPTKIEDVKAQLKSNFFDLYTKLIKNSIMYEKLFNENTHEHSDKLNLISKSINNKLKVIQENKKSEEEQKFKVEYKMSSREKSQILLIWLTEMVKKYLFETYESVIEKRVEKKRELIEIKERERIIDDYRKKFIEISDKYSVLDAENKALKERYENLHYSNDILIKKFALLKKITETLSKQSIRDLKNLSQEQKQLVKSVIKQQKLDDKHQQNQIIQQQLKNRSPSPQKNQNTQEQNEDSPLKNTLTHEEDLEIFERLEKTYKTQQKKLKDKCFKILNFQREWVFDQRKYIQSQMLEKKNPLTLHQALMLSDNNLDNFRDSLESFENAFNDLGFISDDSDESVERINANNFKGAGSQRINNNARESSANNKKRSPILWQLQLTKTPFSGQLDLNQADSDMVRKVSAKGQRSRELYQKLRGDVKSGSAAFMDSQRRSSQAVSQIVQDRGFFNLEGRVNSLNGRMIFGSPMTHRRSAIFQMEPRSKDELTRNLPLKINLGSITTLKEDFKSQRTVTPSHNSETNNSIIKKNATIKRQNSEKNIQNLFEEENIEVAFTQQCIDRFNLYPDQVIKSLQFLEQIRSKEFESKEIQVDIKMTYQQISNTEFNTGDDDLDLYQSLDDDKQNTARSNNPMVPLESISEREEDDGNNQSMSNYDSNRISHSALNQQAMDILNVEKYLQQHFKMEIKKTTSAVLNSLLDQEQTQTLYKIKAKKAKNLRNKKLKMIRQQLQNANAVTPSNGPSRLQSYAIQGLNGAVMENTSNMDYEDLMNEIDIEELDEEEHSFDEEVYQSQLPKRLLQAAETFKTMIKLLPKDEFGDFIYKGTDIQDMPSQKLRDFGSRFSTLVHRLAREKEESENRNMANSKLSPDLKGDKNKKVFTEKMIQTEQSYIKDMKRIEDQSQKNKQLKDTMQNFDFTSQAKQNSNKKQKKLKPQIFMPFNLGRAQDFTSTGKQHMIVKYMQNFFENYKNKEWVKQTNSLSIKLLLKMINSWYYEKALSGKDSQSIKSQPISEYVYDIYYNKYGIVKISEKKLRELFVTILENREGIFKLELFSRFFDIFKNQNFLRREFFFDNTHLKSDQCLHHLKMYLSNKLSGERLHNFIKTYHTIVAEENNIKLTDINFYKLNLKELCVSCEKIYEICIQLYREVKAQVCQILIERGIIKIPPQQPPSNYNSNRQGANAKKQPDRSPSMKDARISDAEEEDENEDQNSNKLTPYQEFLLQSMQTVFYDFEEFTRIMLDVKEKQDFSRDSLMVMFDRERLLKGDEKGVSLEIIISFIFRFELMPV
eukprot:403342126